MITSTQDIKNFFYEFEWKKVFNIGVNMFCEVDRQDKTSIVLNDLTDIGAIIDYYEGDYN